MNCKLTLYTSTADKNGTYPVCFKISKGNARTYIYTKFYCKKTQWNKDTNQFRRNFHNSTARNISLQSQLNELMVLIEQNPTANIKEIKRLFTTKDINSISAFFKIRLEELKKKYETRQKYKSCLTCLNEFSENLTFEDFDFNLLKNFEHHLRQTNSDVSIKTRMSTLKAVFNEANKRGITDNQPFLQYSLSKFKAVINSRSISPAEIKKIYNSPFSDARNYFIFSYYTRGMNFKDFALLRWTDVIGGKIRYTRSKTGDTFVIEILSPVKEVLSYYENKGTYVFPVLAENMTDKEVHARIRNKRKVYNKELQKLGKELEISEKLTTYVARHSFADNLKKSGVSVAIISEALGHSDLKTTQSYLSKFDNNVIDEANKKLLF